MGPEAPIFLISGGILKWLIKRIKIMQHREESQKVKNRAAFYDNVSFTQKPPDDALSSEYRNLISSVTLRTC